MTSAVLSKSLPPMSCGVASSGVVSPFCPKIPVPSLPSTVSTWTQWLSRWWNRCPELSLPLLRLFNHLQDGKVLAADHFDLLTKSLEWIALNPSRYDSQIGHLTQNCLALISVEGTHFWIQSLVRKELEGAGQPLLTKCWPLISSERLTELCERIHKQTIDIQVLAEQIALTLPRAKICHWHESLKREYENQQTAFRQFFKHLIDLHTMSLGLSSLGRPITSQWEAGQQLGVYYMLFSLPFTCFGTLIALGASGQLAVGLTALAILAFFLGFKAYFAWWRPCPDQLDQGFNLIERAKKRTFPPAIGREKDVDRVINCLVAGIRPLLVGPSAVGKTEIMKGVAHRIMMGQVPDSLKNKKLFLINASSLQEDALFDYWSRISMITERLKGFEKEVILFFDEFQGCFGEDGVASQLNTALDEEIGLCAAAITPSDFNTWNAETEGRNLFRRFQRLDIPEFDDEQLCMALAEIASRSPPLVYVMDEAIKAIVEHSPVEDEGEETSRMDHALKILQQAIFAAQNPEEPKPLRHNKELLNTIRSRCNVEHGTALFQHSEVSTLCNEIKEQESSWQKRLSATQKLRKLLEKRLQWEDRLCRLGHHIHKGNGGPADYQQLAFVATLLPIIEEQVKSLVRAGQAFTITPELIKKVVTDLEMA